MLNKFLKSDLLGHCSNLSLFKIVLILFAIGFVAYGNTLFYPFVHDDVVFILQNPKIADWSGLSSYFFKPSSMLLGNNSIVNVYYRPLLEIVYKAQYCLFNANPFGYHLTNIILHASNSILIFLCIILLANDKKMALCAAIIFLIHPVQSEAVASITGISNLLFCLLCLSSFYLYVLSTQKSQDNRCISLYALSLFIFIIALLAKEQSIVLPFLFVLYEFCFFGSSKASIKRKLIRVSGFFAILIVYMLFRKFILGGAMPSLMPHKGEFYLRILSIPRIILMYLGILVFPVNLHFYRTINMLDPCIFPLCGLLLIVIAVILTLRFSPKAYLPLLIFGLGWFLITLLPVINIIPIIVEYSFLWTPEHFLYISIIGFSIFAFVTIRYWLSRIGKRNDSVFSVAFLIIFLIFILATIGQNTQWMGEVPLFERAVKFENNLGRVHMLLAKAYYSDKQPNKAISEYETALRSIEGYTKKTNMKVAKEFYLGLIKEIHVGLAQCYEFEGDIIGAIEEYKYAINITPHDDTLHNNLGLNYLKIGKFEKAIANLKKAIALNSQNILAMNNLAVCYIKKGNIKEAKNFLHKILAINKDFAPAKQNLEKLIGQK